MGYATWTMGGEVIPHVREANINTQEGTITLSCSALNWNIETGDDDPRDEIARIQALTSQYIHNDPLLNGGTKLQVGNGQILTVTDGTDTYTRCAVEPITIPEDNKSTKRIDYDVIIHYELVGSGGSFVYTPDYREYNNIEFYMTTDKSDPGVAVYGEELGWMQITEPENVVKVEVYASACVGNDTYPSYLDVNGEQQLFHYSHDQNFACNTLPFGFEKLTFNLATPAKTITIQTANHVNPFDTCDNNRGAWLQWIRVFYE